MTLARRVAWNTAAQAAARVGTLALALLTTALLTRHYHVSGYGVYVTVTVYVPFFALFFDWGITTYVVRELAAGEEGIRLFRAAVTLRVLLALPVAAVAFGLAELLYRGSGDHVTRTSILIALPMIVFVSASTALTAVLQARLKMDRAAFAEIAGQLVTASLIVACVVASGSLYAVVGALVAGSFVTFLVVAWLGGRLTSFRPVVDRRLWAGILSRALPLGISLMIATVYFRADAVLLSIMKGSHAVGIYGVAYRLLEAIVAFPGFFYLSVFPLLAQAGARRDLANVRQVTQRSFDLLVLAAVPLVLGTVTIAPEIVGALAGSNFDKAVTPLRIVIVGGGLMFLSGLFSYVLIALGLQTRLLWVAATALIVNVTLNLALIPAYSYVAAAAVATASEVVTLVAYLILVNQAVRFLPSLRVTAKALVAGTAMVAVLLVTPTNLAILVAVGATAYAVVLVMLRTHEAIELREMLGSGRL